ncbi:Uncharacterized protein APZ42_026038 [Daphnia magna]|uniref:Uncharacterized protein n=1 Tax=Daphnia magna TaxID=35525 RepID=A0A164SJ78_9CRUS|nr:Uncharacterized protein APZ42_026038 [Daphnia magna]
MNIFLATENGKRFRRHLEKLSSCFPLFTGIHVPNWTTDSPLFHVGTDDNPASFEESSTFLESILRDVQEEYHSPPSTAMIPELAKRSSAVEFVC